jgi:hypothetical protein
MWSMAVVVLDVGAERAFELTATDDRHPVKALAPHGADEALGEGVGLRGFHRCSDDRDPLASKDLIERVGELAVAVVDQKPYWQGSIRERPREVASLLRDPDSARILGAAGQVNATTLEFDEEEHVEPPHRDRVNREEVAGQHARRLAAEKLTPARSSALAGGTKARLSQELAHGCGRDADAKPGELARDPLVAPARFSRAIRMTSARSSVPVGGRPCRPPG